MTLTEKVTAYKIKCEEFVRLSNDTETAAYWLNKSEECGELLTLFHEMKMSHSDWARMKELAQVWDRGV